MPINSFPISAGQLITPDLLNQLVAAIQDGSIFTSVSFVSDLITTLDTRVSALESQVAVLELRQAFSNIREQLAPTPGQTTVVLSHPPILDSEHIYLNGISLMKSGIPPGFVGDYTINGNIITFGNSVALSFLTTDQIAILYQYKL